MTSLMSNAGIFTKVNVPKYLFLLSKNVQTLINFGLTLCVFFLFCILDGITFTWKFILLVYPIACLVLFNIGVGLDFVRSICFFPGYPIPLVGIYHAVDVHVGYFLYN